MKYRHRVEVEVEVYVLDFRNLYCGEGWRAQHNTQPDLPRGKTQHLF